MSDILTGPTRYGQSSNTLLLKIATLVQASSVGPVYDEDVIAYADLLLAEGGSDIRDNSEVDNLQAWSSSAIYNAIGRPDFRTFRASQNMGTSATSLTFYGEEETLVNGPLWDADGILLDSATQTEITSLFANPGGALSMVVVFAHDTITDYATVMGFRDGRYSIASLGSSRNFGVGLPGAAGGFPVANQPTTQNVFTMIGCSCNGQAIKTWKNGTDELADNLIGTPVFTGVLNFGSHVEGGYSWFDGKIAFGMVWAGESTQADHAAIMAALETSLLQGIPLG